MFFFFVLAQNVLGSLYLLHFKNASDSCMFIANKVKIPIWVREEITGAVLPWYNVSVATHGHSTSFNYDIFVYKKI